LKDDRKKIEFSRASSIHQEKEKEKRVRVYICSTLFHGIMVLYSGADAARTVYKMVGEVPLRSISRTRAEVFRFLAPLMNNEDISCMYFD